MMNVKCVNEECSENGLVKPGIPNADMREVPVICGVCWAECQATDDAVNVPTPFGDN